MPAYLRGSVSELTQEQLLTLKILGDLHKNWSPHTGQVDAGKPILNGSASTVFVQCGRKWGKTEYAAYMLWRHCLMHPGANCYYVAPEREHGKKLIWDTMRLQKFGPKEYIAKINSSDLMLRFKNGSFIQIVGSENYHQADGWSPHLLVYDEFKSFNPKFHSAMNPNRLTNESPLIIIGTPPAIYDRNKEQYEMIAEDCDSGSDSLWIRQDSYTNPHISRNWLDKEKDRLFKRGDADQWFREYEAKIVAGGRRAIFPMLHDKTHKQHHADIIKEIKHDLHKLEWYCIADPGTTTCFGVLFAAINPYSKKVYILDEIYEKDQNETSTKQMIPKMMDKAKDLCPGSDFDEEWEKCYDYAAAWFQQQAQQEFGYFFLPCDSKMSSKKETGISIIKDMLIFNTVVISSRCENLWWEMEQYAKDDQERIPKKHDHLIDCLRYLLGFANYDSNEVVYARDYGKKSLIAELDHKQYNDDMYEENGEW